CMSFIRFHIQHSYRIHDVRFIRTYKLDFPTRNKNKHMIRRAVFFNPFTFLKLQMNEVTMILRKNLLSCNRFCKFMGYRQSLHTHSPFPYLTSMLTSFTLSIFASYIQSYSSHHILLISDFHVPWLNPSFFQKPFGNE